MLRDEVVDYVGYWSDRAELPRGTLIEWLGIGRSKFYAWRSRHGEPNGHNAPVPRWFWLEPDEQEAIARFHEQHPLEGYRRLWPT